MNWLSEMLLPVSRGRQSKVHDRGLAKIIQSGCAVWNPNDETVILLPEGRRLYTRAQDCILSALEGFNPQLSDACGASRGLLDAAVRVVKRSGDLPLFLVQRRLDRLEFLGLHTDLEASLDMANDALRTIGSTICSLGVTLRRVDRLIPEGHVVDLLCRAENPLRGEEGLCCPDCGWMCTADSPYRFSAAEPAPQDGPAPAEIPTPGCSTVEALCSYLSVTPDKIVKIMFYTVSGLGLTAVILRGDRQVCTEKVRAALRGAELHPASPQELAAVMGDTAGYMGPVGLPASVTLLADYSAVNTRDVIVGANKKGFHLKGACWGRDFKTSLIADLTLVQEKDLCPNCGAELHKSGLRTIARFCPVDPASAADASLTFFDGSKKLHVSAWSASLDLTSLLSAVIENSPCWPGELAPFDDYVCWDGDDAPASISELSTALEQAGRRAVGDDRCGRKLVDRLAEARSSCAPEIIFLKEENGAAALDVTRGGRTETMTLEQYLSQLNDN
jgi:prolyl-tRNA synthetase